MQQHVTLLEAQKEELNIYCYAINSPIANSGLTPHQVIGHLLQIKDLTANQSVANIPLEDIEQWDATRMAKAEAFSNRIQARLKEIGMPANLLFWGSRLLVLLPNDQERLVKQLETSTEITKEAEGAAAQSAQHIGLTAPVSYEEATALVSILKLLSLKPDLEALAIKHKAWLSGQHAIEELLETGKRLTSLREEYKELFIPEAWQQEVIEVRQNLLAHGNKWYRFMIGAYNRSNQQLAALCKAPLPKENNSKLQYVDAILESKRLEVALQEYQSLATELFGRRWQQLKSNWSALEAANRYLLIVHKQVAAGFWPPVVLDYLEKHEDPAIAKAFHDQLNTKLEDHKNAIQQVVEQLALEEARRFGNKGLLQQPFATQITLLQNWQNGITAIHQAILWNNLEETGTAENLLSLIHTANNWPQAKDLLTIAMQKHGMNTCFNKPSPPILPSVNLKGQAMKKSYNSLSIPISSTCNTTGHARLHNIGKTCHASKPEAR
ncbi:hypothetical protein [Paraflavitalea speifideaquila]|uniref:hypothetical protein n=1 Tax=Paraflavitalea speifideaquila TaxID=3076558 RepID=UPI0028E32503|nr:hypothetical protein [Paraflavitalea speifideiaquila]